MEKFEYRKIGNPSSCNVSQCVCMCSCLLILLLLERSFACPSISLARSLSLSLALFVYRSASNAVRTEELYLLLQWKLRIVHTFVVVNVGRYFAILPVQNNCMKKRLLLLSKIAGERWFSGTKSSYNGHGFRSKFNSFLLYHLPSHPNNERKSMHETNELTTMAMTHTPIFIRVLMETLHYKQFVCFNLRPIINKINRMWPSSHIHHYCSHAFV